MRYDAVGCHALCHCLLVCDSVTDKRIDYYWESASIINGFRKLVMTVSEIIDYSVEGLFNVMIVCLMILCCAYPLLQDKFVNK